ncbi:hypothetical protein NIES2119_11030 [[Phormidium ambiguum] IAM M-71]|uniref:DUF1517 domain-containing protein n=1 Tax=[Phormidium ambiguum] IAM M-71 TaxID=454136 RepID=A0A1U7ILJ9_9CYAN|nr:DUF1517 domain-containing protein [Phormidium ambiguum]OKH38086.1 hypothetical protein NIES2119_11030 [Phormidium ambiguum IAM M-71]
MKSKSQLQFWCTAAFSLLLVNAVNIEFTPTHKQVRLNVGQEALAKRGGGRSGGGSFNRSSPSRSAPSRSRGYSDNNSGGYRSSPTYTSPNVYVAPGGYYGGSYGYYSSPLPMIVLILIVGILGFAIVSALKNSVSSSSSSGDGIVTYSTGNKELDNNIVTVSKIQIGLLSQAHVVQKQLTDLSLQIDTSTPEGLRELMQESVLALLRTPENWTHVSATSKTVKSREEAEKVFNQISIEERTKFSAETLSNVKGKIRQLPQDVKPDQEPGTYIVVTLLVGTENDRPMFGDIYSSQDLKQALEKIAATPPEYLSVFELLWTPQSDQESLTYDEMLSEYANMMQIA